MSRIAVVDGQFQGCLLYDVRVAGPAEGELPKLTSRDMLLGGDIPVEDKFDVLVWRSRIPPYCNYIVTYEKRKPRRMTIKEDLEKMMSVLKIHHHHKLRNVFPVQGAYGRALVSMEILISAVASDLISRFISSVTQNYRSHIHKEDDRRRLERILLRMHSVVEEAGGRHITNQGMILQLKGLVEGFYLGCYMLDKIKVRDCFSYIFFFKEDDLKTGGLSLNSKASQGKYLFVIEFIWDVDEAAWTKFQSYLQNMPATGIKVVVIGRTEDIAKFGTSQPIRVKRLSEEEYWYYFKALAFGSMDPDEHPKLASLAMQLSTEMNGSFLGATMFGELLRANPNTQFWKRILLFLRELARKHLTSSGLHPEDLFERNIPVDLSRIAVVDGQVQDFMVYDVRVAGPAEGELPKLTSRDILLGGDIPVEDKFDVLVWRSRIPPYCNYIVTYEKQKPRRMVGKRNTIYL
uniref:Uncharacterized protein n=1 Tax=Oryza nivara TaxID=4536 RepID=A0A0E0IYK7_ORYNI